MVFVKQANGEWLPMEQGAGDKKGREKEYGIIITKKRVWKALKKDLSTLTESSDHA